MTHFNLNRMLQGCSAFIQTMVGNQAARNDAKRVNNHVLPLTCPLLASSLRLTCPIQLRRIALILCVLVLSVGQAWAVDPPAANFTVTPTLVSGATYEATGLSITGSNKGLWVEVPSASAEGFISIYGDNNADRYYYIYGSNGTVKDTGRGIKMVKTVYAPPVYFSPSDIYTTGGKYYLVFYTTDDFKASKVQYTLCSKTKVTTSSFYPLYANTNKTAAQLKSAAGFPANIVLNIDAVGNSKSHSSTVETPHDFKSNISTATTYYYITPNAVTQNIFLGMLANVKSIRLYGDGNGGGRTFYVTVTKVSGDGSPMTVSNIVTTNTATIKEWSTGDLTSLTGYDADTYYTYTITYSGNASRLWGIYVEAGAASGCSSYSFHYGTHDASDWTTKCFEYSGAGDVYYVNNFIIPNKPNFYVGNQGVFYNSNLGYGWGENNGQSRSFEDAWSNLPFAASQGDGSGTRPKVGAATGAKGKIRVYDTSNWNNMFVAFEPDGYVLYFNGHEYPFNFVSGNEYRSNLVELNSSSVVGTVAVGVKDGEGNYVSTDNSQEMRHVFFVPSEAWKTSGAKFAIHYWGAGDARTGFLSAVPGKSGWYEGWLPSGATGFQFERQKSDATEPTEGNRWTAGEDQTLSAGQNCYTMTATGSGNWDGAIEKSLYSAKGVYRIWDNSTAQNWYVNFVPHYVLHYDANGGSGEPADQSVAADASPCQLTVSATEPTRTDYVFQGWNPTKATADAGTIDGAWDPGDTHTMTGDVTLYAVWQACTGPTISANGRTGIVDGAHEVGDELGTASVTATAGNGGALSYKWYYYDDSPGKPVDPNDYTAAPGTNNQATYQIPSSSTCTARHYFCVVSEEGCSTTVEGIPTGALTLTEPADPCTEPEKLTNEIARFFVPCGTNEAYNVTDQASSKDDNTYSTTEFNGSRETNATTGFIYGKLAGDANYIQLKLNTGNFRAGDVVNAYFSSNSTNNNLKLKSSSGNELGAASASVYDSEYVRTYTLTAADIEDNGSIKFFRKGSDIRVNRIIVTRPNSPCFTFTAATSSQDETAAATHKTISTSSGGYAATLTGGAMDFYGATSNVGCNKTNGLVFDADDDILTVTLSGTTLPVGAIIHIEARGNNESSSHTCGFVISNNAMTPATNTSSTSANPFAQSYVVTAGDGIVGTNTFTIKLKAGNAKTYLKALYIIGCEEASCADFTVVRGGQESGTYTVGSYDGSALTCTPSPAGTYTYAWKQYPTGGTPATAVAAEGTGNNTNSFTPNPAAADTYIYFCDVTDACSTTKRTTLTGAFAFTAPTTYTLTASATVSNQMTAGSKTGAITGSFTNNPVTAITSGTTTSTSSNTFTVNKTTPVTVTAAATIDGTEAQCDECTYVFDSWENIPATVTADVSTIHAVYKTTYTISFKETDESAVAGVSGTSYVYGEGKAASTLPTPSKSGYTFDGWYKENTLTNAATDIDNDDWGNVTYYAKWTEDECTPTTLFSMVVADSGSDADVARQGGTLSLTTSNHLSTLTGGTATLKNNYASSGSAHKMVGKDNDERHLRFKQNDHLLIVTFENALAEGDIISFTGYGSNQLSFTTTETRATTPATSSKSYTIPSASGLIGATTIYIWRSSGSDTYIKSLTVTRPCDESAETCKTPNITNIASTTNMTTAETKSLNVTVSNADALTGTVSYAWTNSDGTAIAAAAKATGTTTARLTLTEPAAGTYTFMCTVTNDCGGGDSQSATSAVFTVVVTASTGCTEIAKVIVSSASAGTGSGTKIAETSGYGVNLENTKTTHDGKDGYKLGSSKYIYLQLASGEQFQNGDKVKVYITHLSDQGDHKLHIFQGTTAAGTEVATVNSPALGWNEATLSNVTTGNRSLTIHRSSGTTEQNHGIYAFAVERCVDCTPATHEGLAYTKTSYTVGETAEALTVTNPENVDTYQWKWNTTNDRTGGTTCGTNAASFTPPTTSAGTRYYWCELTNDCGTVKTSAVGITVSADLSDVTVTWTDPAEVNYGGGGYTIKAKVDPAAWDGTLTASMLTAPEGIRIYDVEINNTEHTLQAKFDVQTTFDREANATAIPFALTLAATANYDGKIDEHNVAYSACAAGGGGGNVYVIGYSNNNATNVSSSSAFRAYETASDWYTEGNTTFTDKTTTDGFTIKGSQKSGYYWRNDGTFSTSGGDKSRLMTFKLTKSDKITITWTGETVSFSKVRIIGRNTSDDATTYTVSNGTTEKTFTYEAGLGGNVQIKEVEMEFVSGSTKGITISGGTKECNVLIELTPASSGGTETTVLTWSNSQASGATLAKDEGTADFAVTANRDAVAAISLGALTYSSSDPSVATVNATTGQVHIADNIDFGGETYKETTITATLAASGCYKRAHITYILRVNARPCEDVAGTVTPTTVGCTTTLALSGYTAGATIQWYKDGEAIPSATSATYAATASGEYYAVTTKNCDRTSNTVAIASTAVSATKIVDEWYVKNGRRTPDIALVQTTNATGFTVTSGGSPITSIGGCEFYRGTDGIIYLKGAKNDGTAPSGMTEGDDVLSITATGCSDAAPVSVTIHRQVETDKYVLAYVVTGDQDGGWTQNPPANQTTGVELYRTLTNHFDLQATNIYATTDEQKIKEYYSRYDIIFITDYPNTKTTNKTTKKSYVNALGAMIDIRPILTMEAWVSGLSNWSAKGVAGNPKSPTTRQYNMLLQCKDHEIFSGTTVETIGEGDDVKFKINMVDSTKALYDTLDTKYGAGTHKEKEGYCYGKHPALQGFVYDEALADMLPLGLIDDGAGNDLQVGLERQKEMEARMMVLGINADAMERLSEDGETVIVNALKYLMKKDAEDISDCSIYFDNAGGNNLWSNVANWGPSHLTLPQPTQEARILQPCIVQGEANAASIKIISGGKYNHGTTDANGSLTIAKSGILKVGGRIVAASAPNYYEVRPTDASKLIIQADDVQTGALIHGHKSGELNATVQLVSKSYSERVTEDGKTKKKKYWQYIGLPVQSALAEDAFYGAYTYKYNEPSGWEKKGTGTTLEEFWGIGLSVDNLALGIPKNPVTFNISGALALATDRDIELTKTAEAGNGENMIGNSWTAPIHLVNMTADDFENAKATIYIYNTGRDEQAPGGDVGTSTSAKGSTQPGQWISIPVGATKLDPWQGPSVIPAMQAFEVDVADGSTSGTLHLNYDKHVRNIGTAPQENAALKAPKRYQSDEPSMMRLRVADTATYTDLYLIEGEEFSDEFDNGYDGKYQPCDGRSATLYALSPIGNMAVLAQQSINNTAVVFRPGRQNEYTFTFGYNGEVAYYLNDLLLEQSTEIREGNEYRFTCNEGDMESRFVVSTTPFGAPDITTGIGNAGHPEKVQKIMYKDHIYIIRAGRVYDIVGKEVR